MSNADERDSTATAASPRVLADGGGVKDPMFGQCPKCGGNLSACFVNGCPQDPRPPLSPEAEGQIHDIVTSALDRMAQACEEPAPTPPRKVNHIGAPACFALELACKHLRQAFGGYGVYQVGSSLERADWRDVDLRLILQDDEFAALFPAAGPAGQWEQDPRWLVMTVAIAAWLKELTGLPIDFQFQPQTHANERHKGPRNALGLRIQVSAASPHMAPRDAETGEIVP